LSGRVRPCQGRSRGFNSRLPLQFCFAESSGFHQGSPRQREGFCFCKRTIRRGTQAVRERSAKPLCVSSILTRASTPFCIALTAIVRPFSSVSFLTRCV